MEGEKEAYSGRRAGGGGVSSEKLRIKVCALVGRWWGVDGFFERASLRKNLH